VADLTTMRFDNEIDDEVNDETDNGRAAGRADDDYSELKSVDFEHFYRWILRRKKH